MVTFTPFLEEPQLPFETVERMCRSLFSNPRKTLRNNVRMLLSTKDATTVDDFLACAEVDGGIRPSDLDREDIERLGAVFAAISTQESGGGV